MALFSALGLIAFSIAFVDRPFSTWSHTENFSRLPLFAVVPYLVRPLLPGSFLCLIVMGLAVAFRGWKPGEKGLTFITGCLAILVALAITSCLKFIFGRTWPESWMANNPSWIRDGAYDFLFFHGGNGWSSFPSGATTAMTALAAVLWVRIPRWRALWASLVLLVAVKLLGSNEHFVSDVIAGAFIGATCAASVMAFLQKTNFGKELSCRR